MKFKPEVEYLSDISRDVKRLVAVVGVQGKEENEKIRILSSMGWNAREIGNLLGIAHDAVRKRKFRSRK